MARRTHSPALLLALAAFLALAALAIAAGRATAAPAVSGEFDLPGLGSNNKLVQGPDGNIWVTLDGNDRDVARVTPEGAVQEFDLDLVTPLGIAVGPENLIWIARNGGLLSFDPSDPPGTDKLTDIAEIGAEPSVALGPDGNLWVVGKEKQLVVRVPPAEPAAAVAFPVPGLEAPKDIDAAGSLIVIAGLEHVYAVDTAGKVVGDQKTAGQNQRIAGGPAGQYAYTQPGSAPKEIGLLSPGAAPAILSAEGTDPFGIALGSDGAYWSPEFISDGLLRITPAGAITPLTGFAKGSAPRQIAAGPGNTLWVTLEMTKKIGRVSGLEPPLTPTTLAPRTNLKGGPKGTVTTKRKLATVRFRFASPDAGARFQCRIVRVRKGKGGKASAAKPGRFAGCKSPRTYNLRPGRYRFEVRAVLAGVLDTTPARRGFRVVRVNR